MNFDSVLFDLDGTLTDSADGIINSFVHALKHYGLPHDDREALRRFVGPPLPYSFSHFCGFSPEKTKEAVAIFREYYKEQGIYENVVYDGVPEMLAALKNAGKTLVVATSKPEEFAKKILARFDLAKYFTVIAGATMDEKRTDKAEVIAYALSLAGITDKTRTVMIGDREHDILGAKKIGIMSLGVLYGYGDLHELQNAGADGIAQTPRDVVSYVLQK